MKELTIIPESSNTSKLSPIILRETVHSRTTFECQQVDNYNDLSRNIKGKLIIQKKNKDISSFDDRTKFSRKDISPGEYVEISLDTGETYNLVSGLSDYYQIVGGKTTDPFNKKTFIEMDERIKVIKDIFENKRELFTILSQIDLSVLNAALNIENLKRIKEQIKMNMKNEHETSFWQKFFETNAWVLSQLFHAPMLFHSGQQYLGGKGLDNSGGQYTDFIYKNIVTNNAAIIEIKSPTKPLIGKKYRQVYTISDEVSGAVSQVLKQRSELYRNYASLVVNNKDKANVFLQII